MCTWLLPQMAHNCNLNQQHMCCMRRSREGGQGVRIGTPPPPPPPPAPPPPPEKSQSYSFLTITGQDSQENHKATKLAFNVGPSSAHQQKHHLNGGSLAGRWPDDGTLLLVFSLDFISPHRLKKAPPPPKKKKKKKKNTHPQKAHQYWTPSCKIFWIRTCAELTMGSSIIIHWSNQILTIFSWRKINNPGMEILKWVKEQVLSKVILNHKGHIVMSIYLKEA